MSQSNPIADYAGALARELSFDPALSRRVRAEVEDHLWEAAADGREGPTLNTQHRVIAGFGEPSELARQYAAVSLLSQLRRARIVMGLAVIGIFAAMWGRVAWYRMMQWQPDPSLQRMTEIGLAIDRYAFMFALVTALIAWVYIGTRRAPLQPDIDYVTELRRGTALCVASAGALAVAVVTETVLTTSRLMASQLSAAALIPALTLVAEVLVAGLLVLCLRTTVRRRALAGVLFHR
jgi:hypothetical protein